MKKAIFEGLVVDENDNPVTVAFVGDEPCYVVNDAGFLRHIPSEQVDRQIFKIFGEMVEGHEEIISEQTAKMLGQDDIFSMAMIANQLKNLDKQFDLLMESGIPEEMRAYLGMMGFKIIVDFHGDVIELRQPGMTQSGEE